MTRFLSRLFMRHRRPATRASSMSRLTGQRSRASNRHPCPDSPVNNHPESPRSDPSTMSWIQTLPPLRSEGPRSAEMRIGGLRVLPCSAPGARKRSCRRRRAPRPRLQLPPPGRPRPDPGRGFPAHPREAPRQRRHTAQHLLAAERPTAADHEPSWVYFRWRSLCPWVSVLRSVCWSKLEPRAPATTPMAALSHAMSR